MTAIETIEKLANTSIISANLKFCLVNQNKLPFTIHNVIARPNKIEDFVDFEQLLHCTNISSYNGIGISIQASNICAIDVDNCFSIPNELSSADDRAKYFLNLFKNSAYCEFSFSGTGLRILFRHNIIEDYSSKYYIKNEAFHIEYYQPNNSFRYVTLTGNVIYDNNVDKFFESSLIYEFLDLFMKRPEKAIRIVHTIENENRSYEELMKIVKRHYLTNTNFQNLWFNNAPGSGKDESERDYHLVAYLFENITQDKDLIKQIFETSNFFKTKDSHHIYKWTNQNYRYFNYLYDRINRR